MRGEKMPCSLSVDLYGFETVSFDTRDLRQGELFLSLPPQKKFFVKKDSLGEILHESQ